MHTLFPPLLPFLAAALLTACRHAEPVRPELPALAELAAARSGHHPDAAAELAALATALTSDPEDPSTLGRAAVLLADLGLDAEARAVFARALAVAPEDSGVRRTWGRYLLLEGELVDAEHELALARTGAPDDVGLLLDHAESLALLGRTREAVATLERAHEVAPGDVQVAYRLALELESTDPARARTLLEHAAAADPWHLGAHANLARLLGDSPEAAVVGERHRELARLSDLQVLERPESVDRYAVEARYFANGGKLDEARAVVAAGLARHPGDAELAFVAGVLHAAAGEPEAARDALLASLAARPGERKVLERLAGLFADGLALDDASRVVLERAAAERPDDPLLAKALGR